MRKTAFLVVLAASCSNNDPVPATSTGEKQRAGESSSAVADVARGAAPTPADAASAALATKLGPIELTATSLDLAALFPGATIELHAAVPAAPKPPPGSYTVPTIVVRDGTKVVAELELAQDRVAAVNAYTLALAPSGFAPGGSTAALATAVPAATCDSVGAGRVWCMDTVDIRIAYVLDRGGEGHDHTPVGKMDDTVRYIRWITSPSERPALAKMPPAARPTARK